MYFGSIGSGQCYQLVCFVIWWSVIMFEMCYLRNWWLLLSYSRFSNNFVQVLLMFFFIFIGTLWLSSLQCYLYLYVYIWK